MDSRSITLAQANVSVRQKFMAGVYGWMASGLLISAVAAFFTANTLFIRNLLFGNLFVMIGLVIIEFVLVFTLVGRIAKMSVSSARFFFILYSIVNGITLSSVLLLYTGTSIAQIFFTTALMFGAMSVYGMKTKTDLSSFGRYFTMAIIGIIIASLINMFMRSGTLDWIISIVSVVVFTGLTAYDTQKMLRISVYADGSENFQKVAIIGALELYLDFINMFLALLRLFGSRD